MTVVGWVRALVDLVLPRTCAGCGASATWWCPRCAAALRRRPVVVPLAHLEPCVGIAPYRGVVGSALVAWKERGALGPRAPLADALARAVLAAASPPGTSAAVDGRIAVVPVPSRPSAVRARGCDVLAELARETAGALRRRGVDAVSVPCLVHRRRVVDQTGLDPLGREQNLRGAIRVRGAAGRFLAGRAVVVVDDVVTTGATLAEATRALRASVPGCAPACAVVAVAGPAAASVRAGESLGEWVVRAPEGD